MDKTQEKAVIDSLVNFVLTAAHKDATPEQMATLPAVASLLLNYHLQVRPR